MLSSARTCKGTWTLLPWQGSSLETLCPGLSWELVTRHHLPGMFQNPKAPERKQVVSLIHIVLAG